MFEKVHKRQVQGRAKAGEPGREMIRKTERLGKRQDTAGNGVSRTVRERSGHNASMNGNGSGGTRSFFRGSGKPGDNAGCIV